jgi:lysozyme
MESVTEPPSGPNVRLRRWLRRGLGLTIAVVVAGAVLWYRWLPSYRPRLDATESYGIDVSSHQGDIDWQAVASDDIRFAYLKASEGGDLVDKRFAGNWDAAGDAGIERGAYHFFTLCRPGLEQARNFLRVAPLEDAELPPALDLELGGNCRARPTAQEVSAEVDAFVDLVEAESGRRLVLYVLGNWEELYPIQDDKSDRPRWARRLVLRPDGEWYIWQFSGAAKVKGIRGPVDLNVMRRRSSSQPRPRATHKNAAPRTTAPKPPGRSCQLATC